MARLDATRRRAFDRLAADLARVFGDRFEALVVGAHGAAAAFVSRIDAADLEALAALADTWHDEGLPTPLVLTPEEFRRSLDTFPAEYQTLLDHHVVVAGRPPFDGVSINPADLRRACEAQARGHLVHLRQGWIDAAGHTHGLAALLAQSAASLRVVLARLAQLHGEDPETDDALAAFAARTAGLSEGLVSDLLSLENAPHRADDLVPRLPEYLRAAEQLWTFVDRWRSR